MVTTRRQQQQLEQEKEDNGSSLTSQEESELERAPPPVEKKRSRTAAVVKEADHPNTNKKKQRKQETNHNQDAVGQEQASSSTDDDDATKAKCAQNQPLIHALQDLWNAVSKAQIAQPKLRFQATQLREVISTLSQFQHPITSGQALAKPGKTKVQGLGSATADYIDDFLQHGHISAIQEYKDMFEEYQQDSQVNHDVIYMNRAPILTLWVVMVCQRQGYTHDEALTHAKWISAILARSKGKALGKWKNDDDKDNNQQSPNASTSRRNSPRDKDKTNPKLDVFGHIRVPVVQSDTVGQRHAVLGNGAIDPKSVERYLENALGGNFNRIHDVLQQVAESMEPDTLKEKAYDLYERMRPEWQGWAQPGKFDLAKVRALVQQSSD